jgi:hypothetical protein
VARRGSGTGRLSDQPPCRACSSKVHQYCKDHHESHRGDGTHYPDPQSPIVPHSIAPKPDDFASCNCRGGKLFREGTRPSGASASVAW